MLFRELSKDEFQHFSNTYPDNNFWQTTNMAQMRENRGYSTSYVGIIDQNHIIAACMLSFVPIFRSYSYCKIMRGPLLDFTDLKLFDFFHHHLIPYLKKKKCLYLHMDPYIPYKERDIHGNIVENGYNFDYIFQHLLKTGYSHEGFTHGIDPLREPRWMYTINTDSITKEQCLKRMERKAQRSIQHVIRYNIQIHEMDLNHLHIYKNVIKDTTLRRGFEFREDGYYENVYNSFNKDGYVQFLYAQMDMMDYIHSLEEDLQKNQNVISQSQKRLSQQESPKIRRKMDLAQQQVNQIIKKMEKAHQIIEEDGQNIILAAGLFFTYGQEVLCLMSGVYEKYMQYCSPYALHWHMLQYCIDHGFKRYNLYGISGIFDDSAEDYGVYLFKKGFNGNVIELMGDFEYIVDPKIYSMYQTLRKIKHKISG